MYIYIYICWSKQSNHRLGNEELSFVEKFCYLGLVMIVNCRDDKDIKKQFMRQNAVGNMLLMKFSFAPIESKVQVSSHIVTPFMDVLFGVIHSRTLIKLPVSYSDTFKHLINVPRYTWSILAFAMNGTNHINVVFRNLPTAWWAE